eukprot:8866759-Ditylum_brightwellii.AAC.1
MSPTSPTKMLKLKKLQEATNTAASCTESSFLDFQYQWFWFKYIESDDTFVAIDLLVPPMTRGHFPPKMKEGGSSLLVTTNTASAFFDRTRLMFANLGSYFNEDTYKAASFGATMKHLQKAL